MRWIFVFPSLLSSLPCTFLLSFFAQRRVLIHASRDKGTITSADSPARTIASGHADLLVDYELDNATKTTIPAPVVEEEILDEEALAEAKKKAEKLRLIKEETQSEGSVSVEVYVYVLPFFSTLDFQGQRKIDEIDGS